MWRKSRRADGRVTDQQGRTTFRELLRTRKILGKYLHEQLQVVASEFGERVLHVPSNDVRLSGSLVHSLSITTDSLTSHCSLHVSVLAIA